MTAASTIDAQEDRKTFRERERRVTRSIAREWQRTAYDPRRHMTIAAVTGDASVLYALQSHGRDAWVRPGGADHRLQLWCAGHDIAELIRAVAPIEAKRALVGGAA